MALYLDQSARDTLLQASSKIWGYNKYAQTSAFGVMAQYSHGTAATGTDLLDGTFSFTAALTKDATETLSTKNVPRLGDTYVAFVHPHQSRQLRDDPEWIEVTKYAAPGSFMIGEIGRLNDVVDDCHLAA